MDPDARYVTVIDCELLETASARARQWRGPLDPDPIVLRIAAVPLYLAPPFELGPGAQYLMRPLDRTGQQIVLDPEVTARSGITEADMATRSMSVPEALLALDRLSGGGRILSWGKDELHLMAIGCYAAGFKPPIPVGRFGNAAALLHKAGVPLQDLETVPRREVAALCDLPPVEAASGTEAVTSVARALQELLRRGVVSPADVSKS
ncbi:MAG: exonuclease [Pseudomonadota bacterium]